MTKSFLTLRRDITETPTEPMSVEVSPNNPEVKAINAKKKGKKVADLTKHPTAGDEAFKGKDKGAKATLESTDGDLDESSRNKKASKRNKSRGHFEGEDDLDESKASRREKAKKFKAKNEQFLSFTDWSAFTDLSEAKETQASRLMKAKALRNTLNKRGVGDKEIIKRLKAAGIDEDTILKIMESTDIEE
tara:strand:- start:11372 stop:11941 length:570 start_codon:yes stop_codon:yes gene_type:complete